MSYIKHTPLDARRAKIFKNDPNKHCKLKKLLKERCDAAKRNCFFFELINTDHKIKLKSDSNKAGLGQRTYFIVEDELSGKLVAMVT